MPTVEATGFPPNVLKCKAALIVFAMAGVVTTAAIGYPLPIPFAMVTISGIAP
jgi:hypothetical protein